MDADVQLRISDAEGPDKEQLRPNFKILSKSHVKKHGHTKMVGGVGRGKTAALRQIDPLKEPDPFGQGWVVTRP